MTASFEAVAEPLVLFAVCGVCFSFAMLASWAAMHAVLWLMRRGARLPEGAGVKRAA